MAMQTDQKPTAAKPNEQNAQGKSLTRNVPGTGFIQRRGEYPFGIMPYDFFRMNPFSLLRRMTEEMDRAFQGSSWDRQVSGQGGWMPAIEVSQRDGKYNVAAELPGLDPKDVKVEVDNDALVIQGERRSEVEDKNAGIERTERQYGLFYRSIPLPEGANVEQAQANFHNGVLQVTIPITEQRSNRRAIPVQAESSTSKSSQSHAA